MIRAFCNFFVSLFHRDGIATIGKIVRYALSPRAWRWLLSNIRNKRTLLSSGLIDEDWYRREYPEVVEKGISPVQDFLTPPHPWTRMPNPDFVPSEYEAMNLDVKVTPILATLHYAQNGMRENRSVSTLDNSEMPFPAGAVELRREFAAAPATHRRTAIFASFSGDGRIKDTVLYYLRGLRDVVDNIVFISNNPIFPDEVTKLDGLVRLALFRHHGCYDFGSYKIGWNEAKSLNLLSPTLCDELVVCNDSCYGPVFPFPHIFAEMDRRRATAEPPADFWGMSIVCQYGHMMIPSYFYVFGPAILEGSELDRWFDRMAPCRNRGQVVLRCESILTQYLLACGYHCDALVPASFQTEHKASPIKYPLSTLRDYRDPLVKIKALKGDSLDDLGEVYSFIQKENPELAALIPRFSPKARRSGIEIARAARMNHDAELQATVGRLQIMAKQKKPVDVVLLSLSGDESWLPPLIAALQGNPLFTFSATAVPDIRVPEKSKRSLHLRAARKQLCALLPETQVRAVQTDSDDEWTDVLPSPGIVFHPSASDVSMFRYNPHYDVGRSVLPILLFDRESAAYPLAKEFARQNYAYFWKIVFTDRETFALYTKHSLRKGENAILAEDGNASESCVRLLQKELVGRIVERDKCA